MQGRNAAPALRQALQAHCSFRDLLLAEYPGLDDETLLDTVEGMTELQEILAAVVRTQLDDTALKEALRNRIADMQTRLGRLEKRIETKRALVTSVMDQAGIKKIEEADFTVSVRQTPQPLVVTEEGTIPEQFWTPQPPKLNRKALLDALKAGDQVEGATLGNGSITISVRTK